MAASTVDPFQALLLRLSENMDDNDVKKLKALTKKKIKAREMQTLYSGMDIFQSLVDKGLISDYDLECLKQHFDEMEKPLLNELIADYESLYPSGKRKGAMSEGSNIKSDASAVTGQKTGARSQEASYFAGTSNTGSKCVMGPGTKYAEPYTRGSVLILNDEWGTSKGGISSVHRQIAKQAHDSDFDVNVTTLQKDEKMSDEENKGIKMIHAIKKGKRDLDLDAINAFHSAVFPTLEEINPEVIIGHIPVTAEGAVDIGKERLAGKSVFQFLHTIPEDTDVFKDGTNPKTIEEKEKDIIKWAEKSDVFFSVGPRIYNHYDGKFRSLENTKLEHKLYIPHPDECFFRMEIKPPKPNQPVRILTFGRVDRVGHLKGYDVIAEALGNVCKAYNSVPGLQCPLWDIRGIPENKHKEAYAFINEHKKSAALKCNLRPYATQKEIMQDLMQSHLFIMPSRSEPFGMVGMEAIAAGLPVLITKHSGLADLVEIIFGSDAKDMVVNVGVDDTNRQGDVNEWEKRIKDMLDARYIGGKFEKAKEMKAKLKSSPEIIETHKEYIRMLKGV